jgi:phospholipase C
MNRRDVLRASGRLAAGLVGAKLIPPAIARALSIDADRRLGSIDDVKHIVILMQENRSFDHYFGAMRGTRGFGDRFTIPLESEKSVWFQSNGKREITPFHFDSRRMNGQFITDLGHNFPDQQGAWGQGRSGFWPMFKGDTCMGYYTSREAEFQWALADAFTLCDHHHCSLASCTDPNRVVFWSGSNSDPDRRAAGLNSDQSTAEITNERCIFDGEYPQHRYRGSALPWKCIPEILQEAGISWRIYWDPNDGWNGIMNGALAFEGFRSAKSDSAIYRNGLSPWLLEDLKRHAASNSLPSVSWILPTPEASEHPGVPSSPSRGGNFLAEVLSALIVNPESWSKTALLISFDENDGLFDHMPPPAVPSYNPDGTLAGKSTVDIRGMHFEGATSFLDAGAREYYAKIHRKRHMTDTELDQLATTELIDSRDTGAGKIRPFGLGPRVPLYIVSPWSRGGWINSQVFDHTSVGQFIEKRFRVQIPAISPWHRTVSGDLTSAFDFERPNVTSLSRMPDTTGFVRTEMSSKKKSAVAAPSSNATAVPQESGTRPSRALPYELQVDVESQSVARVVRLTFRCTGAAGVVFHVYDRMHLDRIPRRYTVGAGRQLDDVWEVNRDGSYDLAVYAPNGFYRRFRGSTDQAETVRVEYGQDKKSLCFLVGGNGSAERVFSIVDNVYSLGGPWQIATKATDSASLEIELAADRWYDFSITSRNNPTFIVHVAGRIENGEHSTSDPIISTSFESDSV